MKQNRNGWSTVHCLSLISLILLAGCSGCATVEKAEPAASTSTSASSGPAPREATSAQPMPTGVFPTPAPYYPPPNKLDLCGEPVPLNIQDVYERFDKEFTVVVYNHAQVYLWLKRMERYFPWIEERLRSNKLPEDLKYVAIAESDLLPNVCSPKGAAGPWQFMPTTGSSYGLSQHGSYDSRYDFERSTEGAFRLLDDLHKRYNSWSMAIAAYNCGDKRILDEARSQRVNNYYLLKLPQETERYVFRILAIKAVLSNPAQYGYNLPKGHGYPEHRLDRVTVTLSSPVPVQTIASAAGTTFREFKRLNPTFRSDDIPAGTFELKLPEGTAAAFEENFKPVRAQAALDMDKSTVAEASPKAPEPKISEPKRSETKAPVGKSQAKTASQNTHVVKKGENLASIAKQYKVSVQELKNLNKIVGNSVAVGQRLKLP